MRICILSTLNHPLLNLFLEKYKLKNHNIKVIIDNYNDKQIIKTFNYRTNFKFTLKSIYDIKNKYPFYFFNNHNSNIVTKFIKDSKADLIINLGTPRILKNNILNSSKLGVLNCHPGILPYYRGCNCVEWALLNNDVLGNTCHIMTDKIDEGPIILKSYIQYSKKENYFDLRFKVYKQSLNCINKSIKILSNNPNIKDFEYPKNGKYWNKMNKNHFKKVLNDYS